jgi:HAD superfamily hydrolase (TIGR01509 family)
MNSNSNSIKAILFDLDGLLVDTETVHFRAYQEVLGGYGVNLTDEMFKLSWLSGNRYGTPYYLKKAGVTDPKKIAAARAEKAELYRELAPGEIKLLPGVETFLKAAQAAGVKLGVATGGYQREYSFTLEYFGLEKYFQTVVGGNEVPNNKPAPDVYLQAAKDLGSPPEETVVFENSDIGMQAGLAAQMKTYVIPSRWTDHQDFSEATAQFKSFDELNLEDLLNGEVC